MHPPTMGPTVQARSIRQTNLHEPLGRVSIPHQPVETIKIPPLLSYKRVAIDTIYFLLQTI